MTSSWQPVPLTDDAGISRHGIAPVIISASRSTDIPAFYSDWLVNRLNRGYCVWKNPFNNSLQYVSFQKTRFFVFWTKNPAPFFGKLNEFEKRGIGYYFQFTLNDYAEEKYEPNLPPLEKRIQIFKQLSDRIGRSRVIWRFDPLLLTDQLNSDELLARIEKLMRTLHEHTEKLVFSFADIDCYRKVQSNLQRGKIYAREFNEEEMITVAKNIRAAGKKYKLQLATCAEKTDFEGIAHNSCIDAGLIAACNPADSELMKFLESHTTVYPELQNKPPCCKPGKAGARKDKGQRTHCGCILSKDIGAYGTCPHLCAYCYANSSEKLVIKRNRCHAPESETI